MTISEEVRQFIRTLEGETPSPWGEEALVETAERLSKVGVDDDSIIESFRATYAAHFGKDED